MDKSLVSRAINQLIGEALEAQGLALVAGRALERIANPSKQERYSGFKPQKIARDALETLEKLKEG
jgi:hypothetical protein